MVARGPVFGDGGQSRMSSPGHRVSIGFGASVGSQAGAVRARPALIANVKLYLVVLENMYSFVISNSDIICLRNNPHRRIYG